jgi:hypothetical protein
VRYAVGAVAVAHRRGPRFGLDATAPTHADAGVLAGRSHVPAGCGAELGRRQGRRMGAAAACGQL